MTKDIEQFTRVYVERVNHEYHLTLLSIIDAKPFFSTNLFNESEGFECSNQPRTDLIGRRRIKVSMEI